MLNEEAAHIASTSVALSTPSNPTLTARSANSGETPLSGVSATLHVAITATNYFGETAHSSGASVSVTSGQVVDVNMSPVSGAQQYNIYVYADSGGTFYLMKSGVGGVNFTLQGAVPSSGTVPPTTDTGTYSGIDQEGMIPVLSGHSASGGNPVYPSGWAGGYTNQAVGDTLKTSVLYPMFQQLYNGNGAFRADPAELIGEAGDIMNLSNDIIANPNATSYRLFVQQSEVPGVRVGAAVSEFQNPITRSIVRIVVHPWWTQGTVAAMTYTLPNAWSNVSNCWEFVAVQDYISVSWPVIDASFRYSMFMFGALVANAPQYSGLLQGIQKSDRSGSTGTWS